MGIEENIYPIKSLNESIKEPYGAQEIKNSINSILEINEFDGDKSARYKEGENSINNPISNREKVHTSLVRSSANPRNIFRIKI